MNLDIIDIIRSVLSYDILYIHTVTNKHDDINSFALKFTLQFKHDNINETALELNAVCFDLTLKIVNENVSERS